MKKYNILLPLLFLWACLLPALTVSVGDGTSHNDLTGYPAVYGGYYNNAREQYLIESTELVVGGGGPGNITSLSFNVFDPNLCGALPNFTIRMGHTAATALGVDFITGLMQVYSVSSYQPHPGLNTHVFDTPFLWDGTSSVVVEVTFDFQSAYTQNASIYYTPTTGIKALYFRSDTIGWAGATTGSQSYNRPNLQFEMAAGGR
jgi:hypothetical protein